MLVGVGGSGRQSLTRLACFIAEMKCMNIELRRGYDYNMFREDIKAMMLSAGAEGKNVRIVVLYQTSHELFFRQSLC